MCMEISRDEYGALAMDSSMRGMNMESWSSSRPSLKGKLAMTGNEIALRDEAVYILEELKTKCNVRHDESRTLTPLEVYTLVQKAVDMLTRL